MEPTLTKDFWLLLARAIFFTASHSFMVIGLLLAIVPLFSYFLFAGGNLISRIIQGGIRSVGWLFFLLPGVSWALLYLKFQSVFSILPDGFWAIVMVHFSMNFFLLVSLFVEDLKESMRSEARESLEASLVFNLDVFAKFRSIWWPRMHSFFFSWLPVIFLWCFSSFSVVLILSMNPRQVSPEIMLFQSLLMGHDGPRVWVLLAFQIVLGVAVAVPVFFRNKKNKTAQLTHDSIHLNFLFKQMGPLYKKLSLSAHILIVLILGFFVSFLFRAVGFSYPRNELFLQALQNSLLLGFLTALFSLFLAVILSAITSKYRNYFLCFAGISPTLVFYLFLRTSLSDLSLMNPKFEITFIALGLTLVNLALYSRWIGERLDILSNDLKEAASLIGMGRLAFLIKIELSFLKPIIARIALYSFLIALGDLSFSMLIADKAILLAPLARMSVQRYDFSLGPALIWIGVLATLFYFLSIKMFSLMGRFKK